MRADHVALLLPEVYQRAVLPGSPLAALLEVMEALHAPTEEVLGSLPAVFDPQRAPERFVPYLAGWVDLDRWLEDDGTFPAGSARLRQLVASAAALSRRRGTVSGLRDTLTLALGVPGVVVDDAVPAASGVGVRPFHVRVSLPAAAREYASLVARIVDQEKPAHVSAEIVYEEPPG
ncbi:MAG: phage tail protein [Kineosporiaceae bacterium]